MFDGRHAIAQEVGVINQNSNTGRNGRPTVADVGEFGLIEALTEVLLPPGSPASPAVLVGPGDDAAIVALADARAVVSTDAMVEGVHFKRTWSSAIDVGTRAAAANLSDIVAMGADPVALVVALGVAPDTSVDWVLDVARGMRTEAARAGAVVVGGDVVRSAAVMLSVTAIGSVGAQGPVLRSGARVGDVVAVSGRLGWAAAGLAVLTRGFSSPRVLVEAHRRPDVDYGAGLAGAAHATSMCDVSDGLLADAGHMAAASGVAIDIEIDRLAVTDAMRDVAAALGADPLDWVLGGGDDHAFLATFSDPRRIPQGWSPVGRVVEGLGVLVDGQQHQGPTGHRHFEA